MTPPIICFSLYLLQIGESGKSVRELEKTISLLKKVVERVQAENEQLKKAPGIITNEQLQELQMENQGLRVGSVTYAACE